MVAGGIIAGVIPKIHNNSLSIGLQEKRISNSTAQDRDGNGSDGTEPTSITEISYPTKPITQETTPWPTESTVDPVQSIESTESPSKSTKSTKGPVYPTYSTPLDPIEWSQTIIRSISSDESSTISVSSGVLTPTQ